QVQMGIINAFADQGQHNHRPKYCVILYIDASFFDQITVFVIKYDPNVFKAARNRAKRLFTINDPAQIPPEGKLTDACGFCEYKHACAKVQQESVPDRDNSKNSVDIDELDRLKELATLEREA